MTTVTVGVLVKLPNDAWPPPKEICNGINFVHGSTAAEFLEKSIKALVVVPPGISGSTARELLEKKPEIEWLHSFSAGVDHLSPNLQNVQRAVAYTNGRGAYSSSLAEYALLGALYFNKKVPRLVANAAENKWDKFTMPVLKNKTLGLVGYGDIAKHTAKLGRAFGMRIVAVRRNKSASEDDGPDEIFGVEEKLELFKQSDFVVCSLPGTGNTINFCGQPEFSAMKSSAVFISIGRGAAVDEDALCDALESNTIAGAFLDVFKEEPLPKTSRLWSFGPDKLILSSHNADLTDDYYNLGWNVWRSNFEAFHSASSSSASEEVKWVTPFDPTAGY
uniref:D-isomer specific 2-hydroxyacid dehydrogenase NAD-binding domain-containing protein n=1 Tax=Aureoumbra lagunensis TaxID=44058 RepID=A0A7S3K635_9STRA